MKRNDLTEVGMMIPFAMRLLLVSLDEWLRSDLTEVVMIAFAMRPLLVSLQWSTSDQVEAEVVDNSNVLDFLIKKKLKSTNLF